MRLSHSLKKTLWLTPIALIATPIYLYFYHYTARQIIFPNGQTITAQLANNPYKQTKGLMYRKSLPQNSGMLFTFKQKSRHAFWMKNTLIPLDLIWLDENLTIVDIKKDVQPCVTLICPTYSPINPANYVLEVNAGVNEENSLKIGDALHFEN